LLQERMLVMAHEVGECARAVAQPTRR
jgi:hypothetical protein